jgi:hypothetical protein
MRTVALPAGKDMEMVSVEQDEKVLKITEELPRKRRWHCGAAGRAVAARFAYPNQLADLEANTDLLPRYTELAEQTCGSLAAFK